MTDVFISYSRKDIAFARILNDMLQAKGLESWIDWQDILPSANWLSEVYAAIEAADTFVFVISETSITSEICFKEIGHAVQNHKRLVPIVVQDVDPKATPSAVSALNWIFFREGQDDFQKSFDVLLQAVRTDLAWVKTHTRLQVRALEWEKRKRNPSVLLRGQDLKDAEQQLALAGAEKDPQPTYIQRQYVLASRRAESQRQGTTLGASFGALGIISICLVIAIVLGILAFRSQQTAQSEANARATAEAQAIGEAHSRATAEANAISNEQEALKQARISQASALAAQAQRIMQDKAQLGLLLAVQAINTTEQDKTVVPSAMEAIYNGLNSVSGYGLGGFLDQSVYLDQTGGISGYSFSPDGNKLVTYGSSSIQSPNGFIRIYELDSPLPMQNFFGIPLSEKALDVKMTGRVPNAILVRTDTGLYLANISDPAKIQTTLVEGGESLKEYALSPDGMLLVVAFSKGDLSKIRLIPLDQPSEGTELSYSPTSVTVLVISPDNQRMIIVSEEGVFLCQISSNCDEPQKLELSSIEEVLFQFSRDSKFLIAHGTDSAQIWDLRQETPSQLKDSPTFDLIEQAGISPDGTILGISDPNGVVSVLGVNDLDHPLFVLDNPVWNSRSFTSIRISHNNQWIVLSTQDNTYIMDLELPDPSSKIVYIGSFVIPLKYEISPESNWIAFGDLGGNSYIGSLELNIVDLLSLREVVFDSETYGKEIDLLNGLTQIDREKVFETYKGHEGPVYISMLNQTGRWLITESWWPDGTVRLWDMMNYSQFPHILNYAGSMFTNNEGSPFSASPNSQWLSSATSDRVRVWDLVQLTQNSPTTFDLMLAGQLPRSNMFTPDSHSIIVGFSGGNVTSWQINTGEDPQMIWSIDIGGYVGQIAISSNQKWLAIVENSQISLWSMNGSLEPQEVKVLYKCENCAYMEIRFSPDSRWLWANPDKMASLWDLNNLNSEPFQLENAGYPVEMAFSLDSTWISWMAGYNFNDAILIDLEKGNLFHIPVSVTDIEFTPDSRWLITGNEKYGMEQGDVLLWDLNQIRSSQGMDPTNDSTNLRSNNVLTEYAKLIRVSANGQWLVVVQDQEAHIWNLTDLTKEPYVVGQKQYHVIESAELSNDGHYLAIGSSDWSGPSITLWELNSNSLSPIILNSNQGPISGVWFTTDSKWLVESTLMGTHGLISLDPEQLKTWACQVAGRNFSSTEWETYMGDLPFQTICPDVFSYSVAP